MDNCHLIFHDYAECHLKAENKIYVGIHCIMPSAHVTIPLVETGSHQVKIEGEIHVLRLFIIQLWQRDLSHLYSKRNALQPNFASTWKAIVFYVIKYFSVLFRPQELYVNSLYCFFYYVNLFTLYFNSYAFVSYFRYLHTYLYAHALAGTHARTHTHTHKWK